MSRFLTRSGYWALFLVALVFSYVMLSRASIQMFLVALVLLTVGSVYTIISFRNLSIPFYIVILSIGGFRFVWSVQAPILPDLYLDRIMVIWLLVVFMVKFFAERRRLKGPATLDLLILAHGIYVFIRVMMFDYVAFHSFAISNLTPYIVYFLAKNIVGTEKQIRYLFVALVCVSVYYHVTSIAEKFGLDWLLWPQYMRTPVQEFIGRSSGPFRNSGIFGFTIGMLLPLNLYFIITTRSRAAKVLCYVNLGLGLIGLFFTYTRGAWMASTMCIVGVLMVGWRHYLKVMLPATLLMPVFALVFLNVAEDRFARQRLENVDTIGARLGTATTALRVWRDHPFIGCGSYRYPLVRGDYVDPVDIPGFKTIRFAQFRETAIHDMYLGPLAEDGVIGYGLQLAIYFVIIRMYVRRYRNRDPDDHFANYFIPLFVGISMVYFFGGLTQSYRHVSVIGTLFYMAAGITYGFRSTAPAETRTGND